MSSYYHSPIDTQHPLVALLATLIQQHGPRFLGPPVQGHPPPGIPGGIPGPVLGGGPRYLGPPIQSGDLGYKERQQLGQFQPPGTLPLQMGLPAVTAQLASILGGGSFSPPPNPRPNLPQY